MKKVLHVLPMNKMSGAEKVALLICKNLTQYKPIVICGGATLKKHFINEGIESYDVDFSRKNKLSIIKQLRKIIVENDIDIVNAHDNIASIYSYIAKRSIKKDIKVISHIHSCYPWLKTEGINKKIDSIFRVKYDENIICGKLVYDFYLENSNYFLKSKFEILSNAIDIETIKNRKIDENLYEEFNIPKNKKIIGFIGRLEEMKGIIPFISELIKQKEKFNDCIFLLVGNGSQEEIIKKMIQENNLEEKVILTGFQDDVYKFYPMMDIFFLPSLYEGLPMVILEAMAFEKCVVAMNVGSIFEVIKNKETGILIDNNIEEFLNELECIKNDEKSIRVLGREAKKLIEEKYSIREYSQKVEELYLRE